MVAFPVALEDFFADIGQVTATFALGEAVETSESSAGEIYRADYGARLWAGSVTVRSHRQGRADEVAAMAERLAAADASFFVAPRHRAGPQYDPDGSILGAASVTILSINSTDGTIRLEGLPAGYQIQRGDYLSFEYLSSPTRYAFHRVLTGSGVGEGGATGPLELTQRPRAGVVAGAAVRLVEPRLKAVMIPGSSPLTYQGVRASGLSFSWRQTLR